MYVEGAPDISKELAKSQITNIIEDIDCITPRRNIIIGYSGPNIKEIVRRAPQIIQKGLRVSGMSVYLDEYYLDVVNPNLIGFHIFWFGRRRLDQRTEIWCWIRLKQGKLKPDGTGSVVIEFFPKLITEWARKTFIQKTPIYTLFRKIYTYVFYDHRRRMFVEECKEYAQDMVKLMKELLKLIESARYPYP